MDPLDEALRAAYSAETFLVRTYGEFAAGATDEARREILLALQAESARRRASVMVEMERRGVRELPVLAGAGPTGFEGAEGAEGACDLAARAKETYGRVARHARAARDDRLVRWAQSHEAAAAAHVQRIGDLLGRAPPEP